MSAPNPHVSVFHFTSQISLAKIRKYKLATERGMAPSGNARAPTPTSGNAQVMPSPSLESSAQPPAKKQRLKLHVRAPSDSQDTIAVSRPKRDPLRIRYSENMFLDDNDVQEGSMQEKRKPSSASSSDLSSVPSVRSSEKESAPAKASSRKRDYSRDFMSYYVAGGDEEPDDDEPIEPKPAPKKPELPKKAPVLPVRDPSRDVKSKVARFRHHVQPPTYPSPKLPPPRQNQPQPLLQLIDTNRKPAGPKEPDTVAEMVKKLEALSTVLATVGGVPVVTGSPKKQDITAPDPALASAADKKDVDDFLAMFDEDDSDDKEDKDEKDVIVVGLNYRLQNPGEADSPLTFGIQFIQNALRSWAQQRLNAQYNQHFLQHQQQTRREAQPPKRGPGRPRKFDSIDEDNHAAPSPMNIQIDLAKTPEGAAINQFQEVIDSGCLRVNAVLPVELTRALRHLYMQIDHLINQGSRQEKEWRCMSYGAQIAAQKTRVEKWKEAQAKAQQEMARQQQLAQQQMLQQMGIPQHQRNHLSAEQAQHQHAVDLERKRSLQHAAQQPHLSKYLTNPLHLNNQAAGSPPGPANSGSPIHGHSTSSPAAPATTGPENAPPHALPSQSSSGDLNGMQLDGANGKNVVLDKMKMYMPNFLPRSGQSMKFSFAPHSELALKTFGAQAFPTNHTGPNLPNRGPMSANPTLPNSHAHTLNGSLPTPVVPSNAVTPMAAAATTNVSDDPSAATKDERHDLSKNSAANVSADGSGASSDIAKKASTFTPSYTPTNVKRSNSVSVASPTAASPDVEMVNGTDPPVPPSPALSSGVTPIIGGNAENKATNLASRYPHPGAIVIDE